MVSATPTLCCPLPGGQFWQWLLKPVSCLWRNADPEQDPAMRSRLAAVVALMASVLSTAPAHAMQFDPAQARSGEAVIIGRGPIVAGDVDRFTAALAKVDQSGRPLAALALDSGGGTLAEAKRMLPIIRARRIAVVIPINSQCASACFLLFAASPRRLAATDALVGVHSASQNGTETDTSLAVTTLMARDARDLGIPPAIIGKMVETTPGRVEWLDPSDLALMAVTVYDGDLMRALRQAARPGAEKTRTASPPAGQPSPALASPAVASPTPAFGSGRDDRRAWEGWLGGLRGPYRDGAVLAGSQINESRTLSCYGQNNVNRGDFTLGCTMAAQRLLLITARMRADPDYAAGWSLGDPPMASSQPVAAGEPVEQAYQGAYFCAAQIGGLTVKLFRRTEGARRHALIVFGPHTTSPNVPRGAFEVEGVVDIGGGALTLAPVKWVLHPSGYPWFGVDGHSDDGGMTYSGRVTGSNTCTRFTLARTKTPPASNPATSNPATSQ
jgi:hypothetical protein